MDDSKRGAMPVVPDAIVLPLLATSQDALVVFQVEADKPDSASRSVHYVNPAFERLTGYSSADALGWPAHELENRLATSDEARLAVQRVLNAIEPQQSIWLAESKRGRPFWCQAWAVPVRDPTGQPTHLLLTLRDITPLVDAEEAIRKHKNRVFHLEQLAIKDPLTGLYNRRFLEEQLARFWAVHQRLHAPLGLAFIDIDAFKRYNDLYGHVRGDDALQAVATVLAQHFKRDSDVVARYGGEEFVVVCSLVSNLPPFEQQLERARLAIQALGIHHDEARAGRQLTVSIGIGYATPGKDLRPSDLLHAADQAMYRAKGEGGNRSAACHL